MGKAVYYAWGSGTDWEAVCVDFDIAVQGHSLEEVQRELRDAVDTFLDYAGDLPVEEREQSPEPEVSLGSAPAAGDSLPRLPTDAVVRYSCFPTRRCSVREDPGCVKFRDVIEILEQHGFQFERQGRGSHRVYHRVSGDGRYVVVLSFGRPGEDVKPGTLGSIIRQSGLGREAFRS